MSTNSGWLPTACAVGRPWLMRQVILRHRVFLKHNWLLKGGMFCSLLNFGSHLAHYPYSDGVRKPWKVHGRRPDVVDLWVTDYVTNRIEGQIVNDLSSSASLCKITVSDDEKANRTRWVMSRALLNVFIRFSRAHARSRSFTRPLCQ